MNIIENIVPLTVFLMFPLTIYLIYIAYMNNMGLKEKNLILDFALFSSIFLIEKYITNKSLCLILFYNIPLLIAYLRDKKNTSLILSIIIVYISYKYYNFSLIIYIIEYLLYYILYLIIYRNNKIIDKDNKLINSFIGIKSFIISLFIFFTSNNSFFSNIIYILFIVLIFIGFVYTSIFLFKKGEEIINLNNLLKESKKRQYMYESLSKLTHELKNPITVCKGYLEIMENKGYSKDCKYIPIISNEIDRTLLVINDFSSLGKLTSLDRENMDLCLLLDEVVSTLEPLFKRSSSTINLNVTGSIYINADFNRLKQVFINILKNSLEAKKENIPLEINIDIKKCRRNIKLSFRDNGIGMDKETLSNINKIFFTTKSNGSGLGVVLSTEIVEMHGGNIKYVSNKNDGTTVIVTLPKK